jgi:triacylglycerol esterase/lipase EstA (alpha/beta hydrolase family)
MGVSRVYLSPGLFGFSTLGSYHYFCHIEAGIRRRFQAAGKGVQVHLVDVHPTASIRRRGRKLVEVIDDTFDGTGPIHLVGHSTGGLDARLVASPTMNVTGASVLPRWAGAIRSVTTMNTPHYGTPLASFFATLSGQRLLYALSALTVAVLKLGRPPLALSSSLVAAFAGIEKAVGMQLRLIDALTDNLVRVLDSATADETAQFLRLIREDQGAIIQLSPESMDLFQAGVEDNERVYYQCVASFAPVPGVIHWARYVVRPWASLSLPIFATLHRLTSLEHDRYPCNPPGTEADDKLRAFLSEPPPPLANDGVVPVRSQVWGKLVWAGQGDHLDVVGHFRDADRSDLHVDWLSSGSGFDAARFQTMLDRVVDGILQSEQG